MSSQFSLYLDHQYIAPLVRQLESAVEASRQELPSKGDPYETRMSLYKTFLEILHKEYLEKFPGLKLEDFDTKLQNIQDEHHDDGDDVYIQKQPNKKFIQVTPKHSNRIRKGLEVQIQLIQWIRSCDRQIFEKKQIDSKYQELIGEGKRTLTLKKIQELVKKYQLPALVVKTRNKQEHFFGTNLQDSIETQPRQEEFLKHQIWQSQGDDKETLKNSSDLDEVQIKEEAEQKKQFNAQEKKFKQQIKQQ